MRQAGGFHRGGASRAGEGPQRPEKEVSGSQFEQLEHSGSLSRIAKGEEPGQPAAANMMEMVWDEEMEEIAQRSVDRPAEVAAVVFID